MIRIAHHTSTIDDNIELPYSKSIYNRIALLNYLYQLDLDLPTENLSKDSHLLNTAISDFSNSEPIIYSGDAGTVTRFMLGCIAAKCSFPTQLMAEGRMVQRPMQELVTALKTWGGKFDQNYNSDQLPISVYPNDFHPKDISFEYLSSSQFVTVLLMLAPLSNQSTKISLPQNSVSMLYIDMTLKVMRELGFKSESTLDENLRMIKIEPFKKEGQKTVQPELDWSAFHYWWCFTSLKPGSKILLKKLRHPSIQGDAIFPLGNQNVGLCQTNSGIEIQSTHKEVNLPNSVDFINQPDLAPTYIVYCALNRVKKMIFKGLQTLKDKESDRTAVLKENLAIFHVSLKQEDEHWVLEASNFTIPAEEVTIKTASDHRMAMSFALLSTCTSIKLDDEKCVSKSYPNFWTHLQMFNFDLITSD